MAVFDAVVVGLGVMGAAALDRLARRGLKVIGIEQFSPGHDHGSSHGETRIIRLGYFEHPSYVPLLREAYGLWRDLEAESGQRLLTVTGIVEIGPAAGELVRGTLASSQLHGLDHDVMDSAQTMQRFPGFVVPPGYLGVFQPDGGFLAAEPAVFAQIEHARALGAEIHTDTAVHSLAPRGSGVLVKTSRGDVEAAIAVVAAGPWVKRVLPSFTAPVYVTRQALGWLPSSANFQMGKFPVFLFESTHGIHYGFPVHSARGLKISKHHHLSEQVDPDTYERSVSERDRAAILAFRDAHLPSAAGDFTAATTCLYTMAPDSDFILDRLPNAPQIIVASPCSGHGFKFAPIIGDIIADLGTQGTTTRDIARFRLSRFA